MSVYSLQYDCPILSKDACSFPYLVSVNSVLPGIIAGNAIIFKPSPQTPLAAERFALALTRAGVPEDVIQVVHLSASLTSYAVQHPAVDFVSFTGSVVGGQAVEETAVKANGFKGVALEVKFFVALPRGGDLGGNQCSSVAKILPTFVQTPTWTIQSESWWTVRDRLYVRKTRHSHIISHRCNV